MAISFPVSLPKENKPKIQSRWLADPFTWGTRDQLLLGRQLQQDGFGVTCVTPVTARDYPLRTSKGAGLAQGCRAV